MSRQIKISEANFSKSALPRVRNFSDEIAALSGLAAWFTASSSFVDLASDGTVTAWYDRNGSTDFTPVIQDGTANPGFITSPEGYPALHFQGPSNSQSPMVWSSSLNAASFTKVIIAKLEDASGSGQIMGFGVGDEQGMQRLNWASPTIGSEIDVAAEGGEATVNALNSALSPALYASAFDQSSQLNSAMSNGETVTITTPSGTAEVTQTGLVLSGSTDGGIGSNQTPMTVYDVLIFDTDILSGSDSTARDLLMDYARAKLGIQPQ